MEKEKLKYWALELEKELLLHRYEAKDVARLCENESLTAALQQAKNGEVKWPIILWDIFLLESKYPEVKNFKQLEKALFNFDFLVQGFGLPDEANE